jgi:nucleoid-associated protein YgaU
VTSPAMPAPNATTTSVPPTAPGAPASQPSADATPDAAGDSAPVTPPGEPVGQTRATVPSTPFMNRSAAAHPGSVSGASSGTVADAPASGDAAGAAAIAGQPGSPVAVTVRPGDTLWGIAADFLPTGATAQDVAAAWPQWYAANRAVIGPDPDLIEPGQRLVRPTTAPVPGTTAPTVGAGS